MLKHGRNQKLSQQDFCQQYNIKYHTFRTWVSRFNNRQKQNTQKDNTILIKKNGLEIKIPNTPENIVKVLSNL